MIYITSGSVVDPAEAVPRVAATDCPTADTKRQPDQALKHLQAAGIGPELRRTAELLNG